MPTRLAILWPQGSGYLNAAINTACDHGAAVLLSCFTPHPASPYQALARGRRESVRLLEWTRGQIDDTSLLDEVSRFAPDVMIVSGWNLRSYLKICTAMRGRTVRVLAMDNPWEARLKQIGGCLLSRFLIAPYFDRAFVPGERQYQFARRLGFDDGEIIDGLFTCDRRFYETGAARDPLDGEGFVFVGRLSPEKGIATLMAAYQAYRANHDAPWNLHVYGAGSLGEAERLPGVVRHGFVQPEDLPAALGRHRVLLMPSDRDPWCVAIQEGAALALPILCTTRCGASVHLVKNGFNGYKFSQGSVDELVAAMTAVATQHDEALARMSRGSLSLAMQFHPSLWFDNLMRSLAPTRGRGVRPAAPPGAEHGAWKDAPAS